MRLRFGNEDPVRGDDHTMNIQACPDLVVKDTGCVRPRVLQELVDDPLTLPPTRPLSE